MKLLSLLLTAILCASASAQTIKTLGYNTTNGRIVYSGTNTLTFSNITSWGGDFTIGANGELSYGGTLIFEPETRIWFTEFSFDNTTNAATTRANLGFSTNLNTLWTATNASNARIAILPSYAGNSNKVLGLNSNATDLEWVVSSTNTFAVPVAITNGGTGATNAPNALTNLGLGSTNSVSFGQITLTAGSTTSPALRLPVAQGTNTVYNGFAWSGENSGRLSYVHEGTTVAVVDQSNLRIYAPLKFEGVNAAANARTTAREIAGSTNTNEPYSGTVALTNTNVLTFSNGVLLRIE